MSWRKREFRVCRFSKERRLLNSLAQQYQAGARRWSDVGHVLVVWQCGRDGVTRVLDHLQKNEHVHEKTKLKIFECSYLWHGWRTCIGLLYVSTCMHLYFKWVVFVPHFVVQLSTFSPHATLKPSNSHQCAEPSITSTLIETGTQKKSVTTIQKTDFKYRARNVWHAKFTFRKVHKDMCEFLIFFVCKNVVSQLDVVNVRCTCLHRNCKRHVTEFVTSKVWIFHGASLQNSSELHVPCNASVQVATTKSNFMTNSIEFWAFMYM